MTDTAAYPTCKHGRKIYERCTECEADMKAGKHGGFERAPFPSNPMSHATAVGITCHEGAELSTPALAVIVHVPDMASATAIRDYLSSLATAPVETAGDVMLAQLCAKSATGVHVRKPDGVCIHCGTQANEMSEDFLRAATLENDGHGYTIWRIGGQQFVPLDQANEAVRLAQHPKTSAESSGKILKEPQ